MSCLRRCPGLCSSLNSRSGIPRSFSLSGFCLFLAYVMHALCHYPPLRSSAYKLGHDLLGLVLWGACLLEIKIDRKWKSSNVPAIGRAKRLRPQSVSVPLPLFSLMVYTLKLLPALDMTTDL